MLLYVTYEDGIIEGKLLVSFTGQLTLVMNEPQNEQVYLRLDKTGLAIISNKFSILYVASIYSKLNKRLQNLNNELLVQAIKLNKNEAQDNIIVWDLTAGFGKDALLMASCFYSVTLVEQNPLLATVLYYALLHNFLPNKNMTLFYANSLDFIDKYTGTLPNIIYLDPMFKDNKSAKSKKDMQIIQYLTHDELDYTIIKSQQLFHASYAKVLNKVVIKRDNNQEYLITLPKYSYTKSGKTVRYDVYTKFH